MAGRREFLSSYATFGMREKVYAVAEAIEIDEHAVGDIERRRVFYDDVLALTRHRYRGLGFPLLTGVMGAIFLLITFGLLSDGETGAAGFMLVVAGIFLTALLLRLILGVDVITVYGRRSSARMRYSFRKGKAARVYAMLLRRIREAQAAAAAARAAEAPPPPPVEPSLAPPPPSEAPPPSPAP